MPHHKKMKYLILGIAGAAGTIGRYLLGGWVHRFFDSSFPYGTLLVNFSGCLVIGFLGTLADERSLLTPTLRLALILGFLGAFTTFSSFAYETWAMFKEGETLFASLNVFCSFVFCFVGLLIGVFGARLL